MVIAQTAESRLHLASLSRTAVRQKPGTAAFACSLFIVCAAAKLPVLLQRDLAFNGWLLIGLFWQDALVAVTAGMILVPLRRWRSVVWSLHLAVVVYVAINAVLMLVLSSPLTLTMARAAGSALQDSILAYVTPPNVAIISGLVLLGILLPLIFARVRFGQTGLDTVVCGTSMAIATAWLLAGPVAVSRSNTEGLHRNAIVAFARSLMPRVAARPGEQDWRSSPFPAATDRPDLSGYRGLAAGRNIVLISLESTGAQYLAPWGAAHDPMPNLSGLARTGLLFENAYAAYPESIKGLLSTLCSIYPAIDATAEEHASTTSLALAQVLGHHAYTNALFHSGRFMYLGMDAVVENRGFHVLRDAGAIGGNVHSSFGVDEPATVQRMLEWIDSLQFQQPFFLHYLPIAGHHPYDAPEAGPFPTDTDRHRYLNALWSGDQALGDFLQGLRNRGLYTNTLFIIYGDHGEAFGQHAGNYGHTLHIYEENVRVPLLIAAPGLIDSQVRVPSIASLIDIAPTVLELLGIPRPPTQRGSSLLEATNRMALFCTDYSTALLGLRDGNFKFIYEIETGRSWLFDLRRDPDEMNSVAASHPQRTAAYRELLIDWARAQRFQIRHRNGPAFAYGHGQSGFL